MAGFIRKFGGLKFLTLFASVTLTCTIAMAGQDNAAAEEPNAVTQEAKVVVENGKKADALQKRTATTLEQRMQTRISVYFRDTPIEDVLRSIADQANVDIVTSPSVTGNVTATLTNVPLEEALNNILAAHGFGYITDKNLIRVAPASEITEISEKLVSRIYRITYADVAEVEKALKNFVSKRGSISANPGTSNIIVTDTESKIRAIDKFIEEIDRGTPQILVEVRIYDMTCKDKFDLGIEWQAGRSTTYSQDGEEAYGAEGITAIGQNPLSGRSDPFISGVFSGATGKTSGISGAIRLGWFNASLDIDAMLKAQQQNINAKLLANPRVLVLDNESATIKIISEIPYQELTETAEGGSMGTTDFREVGVELEVTPHVTRADMVRLHLKPKFSVKTGEVTLGTGVSNTFDQPIIDRREADTKLLIKSGRTVVLGGLRKKEVSQQINKIPLLGDLPLLGALFRFEGEDTVVSELVVFITPWIVLDPTLSPDEQQAYEVTEFKGPQPPTTRAETAGK